MIPWFERGQNPMREPYRPQLHIEKNGRAFIFTVNSRQEKVSIRHAVNRFRTLIKEDLYVRERGDQESSDWFIYLQYCLYNNKLPNGEGYERIIHLSTNR